MSKHRKIDIPGAADAEIVGSVLEDLVGFNLKFAYLKVEADFRETLGEDGLSPRVFTSLAFVVQSPNITQSALARTLGIERSGLVAIVDDLEARGYISRQSVPGDRRVQALVPTPEGKAAFEDTMVAIRAHEDRLFANLTDEERRTLVATLKKIRTQDRTKTE